MGHIKGHFVLLALSVAIITANGQIHVNEGPIQTINSPIQTAQTDPKSPASEVAADPPNLIDEAEQKPIKKTGPSSKQPVWKQGSLKIMAQPPIEETPESISVSAEKLVPAPAPSPPEEQTATLPAEPVAVMPMDPGKSITPEPKDDSDSSKKSPPAQAPPPDDAEQEPADVKDTASPEPKDDSDSSKKSPPAQAPPLDDAEQEPSDVEDTASPEPKDDSDSSKKSPPAQAPPLDDAEQEPADVEDTASPEPKDDSDSSKKSPPAQGSPPDDPEKEPADVEDTTSEKPDVAPIESLTPEPTADSDPSLESPPAQAPLPDDPEQESADVKDTYSKKPVVAPGLDMILRKKKGSNSYPIPDWSWAGYASGNYKPVRSGRQINVMDFGAKRDGKTDDAPAIQEAIDVAGSQGGGTVYLPAGRYLIENQITISKSDVVLKGAGKSLTILYSPKPLSKVVKDGRKHINSVGQSRFSWADGFVRISGRPTYSSKRTLLGKVIKRKSRGWTALTVDTPENFTPGMWVRLYMSDSSKVPTSKSLASSLYSNKVQDSSCGTKCLKGLRGKKDLIRWAVKVKTVTGNKVVLDRPLPMDIHPSWKTELHDVPEWRMPQNCGIEGIRVEFALERMNPHLKEAGFNGIAVENALNAWVNDVAIINSDNALVVRFSSHVTIDGIDINANGDRTRQPKWKTQGHIGIGLYESSDVKVTKFNLKSKMLHDTTVRGTILCVFHNGRGIDLNLDSHRGAPFGTLYSNIDVGKGTRVFTSGGSGVNGFPAAAYTTYWNLKAGSERGKLIEIPTKTALGECTYGVKLAFQGKFIGKKCKTYFVNKKKPTPTDLFASQVYKRLSGIQS